nr:helix-turn-helix domain-containing protein [uncultured Devosia sp.]
MYQTPSTMFSRRVKAWRHRFGCNDVIVLVARRKNLGIRELVGRSRCPETARARQIAMYLSHVVLRRNLREVGLAFGRDRTTVSYACKLIEDLREDPGFDRELSRMERYLEGRANVA